MKAGITRIKIPMIVFATLFMILTNFSTVTAKEEDPNVLVIYTTEDGEINDNQRYLDLLIGHFTQNIRFVSSDEVTKRDLRSVTHIFYYGQFATELPAKFETLFDEFEGTLVAVGYNAERLGDQFAFIEPNHEVTVDQISLANEEASLDISKLYVIEIQSSEDSEILIKGRMKNEDIDYPIMVKQDSNYYYAFDTLDSQQSILFAEMLHDVFQADHEHKYTGYIRLEDVHPLVDPKPLKEIASVLKEKDIPYMVAVIPIYTNESTGKRTTFADSPELIKVLKQIQRDGGSIVLHGYTHQFRSSETGEGFEFWDVENNSPIYAPEDVELNLKDEQEFSSRAEYDKYISELQEYEKEYTITKINKGIDELAKYGLYPLAFEAPHYTMSQYGYQLVSERFSTYVGQVQLSDKDWVIMDTSPYITSPSIYHGMQLLPETMGYVQPEDPHSIQKMIDSTKRIGMVRDGMFAAFYHPYLGAEGFKKLMVEIEKLENVSWIDLKEMDVWVKGDNVSIHTENGKIIKELNQLKVVYSSLDAPVYYIGQFFKYLAWIIVVIGGAAVSSFIFFTIQSNSRNKQVEG
ncbi:uncharacterized protein YdaL [Gracilibacillus halotolerans]|uniref:Uncharacterized protein YdaL n=1 Tax=Gracilibacillus halotolerans TaxID=74386 RepID=A0A841RKG2_9BACI|nr:polysaccharide deacetylase family protein [Gracilibacillus halotolerans]MBB6512357.1 uncharacterized protein YdaL [Gracilibacillus halotolerans]